MTKTHLFPIWFHAFKEFYRKCTHFEEIKTQTKVAVCPQFKHNWTRQINSKSCFRTKQPQSVSNNCGCPIHSRNLISSTYMWWLGLGYPSQKIALVGTNVQNKSGIPYRLGNNNNLTLHRKTVLVETGCGLINCNGYWHTATVVSFSFPKKLVA